MSNLGRAYVHVCFSLGTKGEFRSGNETVFANYYFRAQQQIREIRESFHPRNKPAIRYPTIKRTAKPRHRLETS